MGAGGQYTIRVHGVLDDAQIRAQLASLGKQSGAIMGGGKKGKSGGAYFDSASKSAKNASKSMGQYSAAIGRAQKQQKTFGSTTLDVTKKVVQFGAVTAVIRGVTTGMGAMVQNVFELDSALVEFKKVSSLSNDELKDYTKQAYEAGKATAKTGVEMIDAATQFKKMGYGEQESLQLATTATMFQNIADAEISAGDAAKFINSQMKAFQGEFSSLSSNGERAQKVIDSVNEVANNYAVGTNDLQQAMTKTSAAMGTFGNSFDQTLGIMTAGTEIMVGMPSQVARGWRTIAANISKVGESSKEFNDASGEVNITMKKQNGEIKNTYEFLTDLYKGQEGVSKAWDKLNKDQKTAIALELAGKNNQEKFLAVMNNFETALNATKTAEESHGSAMRENARYMDSLEGRVQALKSAWSRFSNSILKSDTLKNALTGLTKGMDFLASDFGSGMVKFAGSMALASVAGKGLNALIGVGGKLPKGLTAFNGAFGKSGKMLKETSRRYSGSAKALNKASMSAMSGGKKFSKLGATFGKTGKSVGKLALKFGGLASLFAGGTGAAWILGLAAAGVGIYKLYQHMNKGKDTTEKYNKSLEDFEKTQEEYKDISTEIAELQTKVDMGEATKAEEKRLRYLKEQKAELKEQLELKRQLMQYDFKDDVTKKPQKEKYNEEFKKARDDGKSINEAKKIASEATKGYTELTQTTERWTKSNQEAGKILDKVQAAQKKLNDSKEGSEEWRKAADDLDYYQKQYDNAIGKSKDFKQTLTDQIAEWDKVYGSVEEMPSEIRASYEEAKKLEAASNNLSTLAQSIQFDSDNVGSMEWEVATQSIKSMGEAIGVTVDKAGNFNNIDLSTFSASLQSMGFEAEDVGGILEHIGEINPEATISIGNEEVALGQVKDFDQVLEAINGERAVADIEVDDNGALESIGTFEQSLEHADGEKAKAEVEVNGGQTASDEIETVEGGLDTINGVVSEAKVEVEGGEKSKDEIESVEESGNEINGSKYTGQVAMTGAQQAADQASTAKEAGEGLNGAIYTGALQLLGGAEAAQSASTTKSAVTSIPTSWKSKTSVTVSGIGNATSAKKEINSIPKSRSSSISITKTVTNIFRTIKETITGNAKGTKNAPEGLSEVNEEGWEFIRDSKTGQLRIAGGGARTVTYLNEGDTVYTHAQSKRMISDAKDIEIEQHKKGKKGKKLKPIGSKKKKKQENYKKAYDKITTWYNNQVAKKEHQQKIQHKSDKWLADQKKKLRATAQAKLKNLNKRKVRGKGKLKRSKYLARDLRYGQEEAMEEALHDIATESIEGFLEGKVGTAKDLSDTLAQIDKEASHLSAKERDEYTKQAYKNHLEYNLEIFKSNRDMLKNNKITYSDMRKQIEDYYNSGKITAKEYYDYLDEVMEAQLERETKALEKRKEKNENTYDLGKAYVQRQIDLLEKQNEEQEQQNELIELQSNLEKARTQRVKVYHQGQGFVYEQDTEAIREATQALQDYKKEQENPELKAWQDVLDLFDDLEAQAEIKDLENKIGSTVEALFGGLGTNLDLWTPVVKGILASKLGYENILEEIEELSGYEAIEAYLNANGQIDESKILSAINKNRFATGTLNAPAGLARVAKNGYEIALLSKGDAVMPHNISENLMQWGQYSPLEVMQAGGATTTQSFNFDKLILPNVTNADQFIRELNNLPNKAIQSAWSRGA